MFVCNDSNQGKNVFKAQEISCSEVGNCSVSPLCVEVGGLAKGVWCSVVMCVVQWYVCAV